MACANGPLYPHMRVGCTGDTLEVLLYLFWVDYATGRDLCCCLWVSMTLRSSVDYPTAIYRISDDGTVTNRTAYVKAVEGPVAFVRGVLPTFTDLLPPPEQTGIRVLSACEA
nr:hypothetical protein HmN_000952800 [Hymenolepis microstoma]